MNKINPPERNSYDALNYEIKKSESFVWKRSLLFLANYFKRYFKCSVIKTNDILNGGRGTGW